MRKLLGSAGARRPYLLMNESQRTSALAPLRFPVFRGVWTATTVSNVGALIQSTGAAWMMTSIAESPEMVTLVQASVALPIVLLSLIAGAVADNLDRRKMMLTAQTFMFVVSVSLAACTWAGWITPWLLLVFTFLVGCGVAFNAPAWQASVRDMVPSAELPSAVALNSMGFNIARSVGPAIGGAIVAAAGAAAAFAVNAVACSGLIVVLARWRPPPHPRLLPRETLGIAVAAGLRYVAMSPAIRTVLARCFAFGIGASAIMALLPLVARYQLSGGPQSYGLLLGAFGVGAVAGAIASAPLRRGLSTEAIVRWASIAFALSGAVVAVSTQLAVTMAVLLLAGAGWVLALATFNVAVQLSAPRWVVARALSLYQMATFGGMAVGSWLWGVVASTQGIGAALFGATVVLLFGTALGRWLPLVQVEELDLEPFPVWKEHPGTAVPVERRTGPVVVTIDYIIHEADILAFLGVMGERRRIRRRDGALKWRLLRDLADPQLWIERYETPTWLDYIRHNTRMTQDDAGIQERLRTLHRGSEAPRVRRMIERQTGSPPVEAPDARTVIETL
ncbi:MAG TPA: MFS transporter [Gemmatimonadales bacterium]|nr:MFS transporter [Gemmatimonadales bacterium]